MSTKEDKPMEIKDMRAFYAIVEEGNISHAAGPGRAAV